MALGAALWAQRRPSCCSALTAWPMVGFGSSDGASADAVLKTTPGRGYGLSLLLLAAEWAAA
jgi:hypothetical protein